MRGYYPGSGGSNIGSVPWKWGCQVGSFPFIHYNWDSHVHPADDYNPDNGDPSAYDNPPPLGSVTAGNSDGYNQIIEAFNYANCMDSYSYYGFFGDVGHAVIETPQYGINNGFSITDPSKDDLFCLNGIAGNTLTGFSQTVDSRSYLLGGPVNVLSDMNILQSATLTMGVDNSIIDIKPNSQFSVQPNVTFIGTGQYSNTGLFIENTSNLLDLEHATFNSAFLQNYGQPLTIGNNSSFNDYSIVNSNRGNVTIKNSTFTNSLLYLEDQDQLSTNTAQITGCQFTFTDPTYTLNAAIIEDYQNFSITNNIIIGNVSQGNSVAYNGISLCYSGWGPLNHILQGNTISNCIVSGISIYGSQASLGNNNISNNQFGVEMLDNNSQTSLSGVPYRVSQEIYNCTENEIYATNNCFPNYMRCNEIYNENNTTNPFVYYDNKCHNYTPALDVMYNCWGDNIQDPSTVLYANCGNYLYNPTMCPQKNGGGSMSYSPDENMYNTAMSDDSIGDYSNAKSVFQLLIETYPESNFSRAAMKQQLPKQPKAGKKKSGKNTNFCNRTLCRK